MSLRKYSGLHEIKRVQVRVLVPVLYKVFFHSGGPGRELQFNVGHLWFRVKLSSLGVEDTLTPLPVLRYITCSDFFVPLLRGRCLIRTIDIYQERK